MTPLLLSNLNHPLTLEGMTATTSNQWSEALTIQQSFPRSAGGEVQMLRGVPKTKNTPKPMLMSLLTPAGLSVEVMGWICRHWPLTIPWWEAEPILTFYLEGKCK